MYKNVLIQVQYPAANGSHEFVMGDTLTLHSHFGKVFDGRVLEVLGHDQSEGHYPAAVRGGTASHGEPHFGGNSEPVAASNSGADHPGEDGDSLHSHPVAHPHAHT